ncbi:response regulator transcription factor [Anaerococcus sp. mt242]|uniref:response regulator transcription factor n=1 Tax=Anaerococcus sp. mt242 TaxID=2661917 RepID=UPI0019321291|nr:response regulator transcription factor [Anaerococcus sp. mt242]MBM0045488.1 response regulator transcription factor [Anaerococcus sp. mt242]
MNPIKIFIVEDDEVISNALKKFLQNWSYDVYFPEDFSNVYDSFIKINPDLILLDVSLPFFNGYYWCEQIRKTSNVPIIFISSADENLNKIMAMNMGADDYITKPFDLELLLAKIKAILRRTFEYTESLDNIAYKDVIIDRDRMILKFANEEISLSKNEYLILEMMFEYPEKVFRREEFMDKIWQTNEFIDDNTLTVNVMRLRNKLDQIGLKDFIKTKKKVGYYIERNI